MLLAHVGRRIDGLHLAHFRGEGFLEVLRVLVFLSELVAQVFPVELHAVIGADRCSPLCVNGAGSQKGDDYLRDTTCVAGGLNVVVTSSQNRNIAISAPA